MNTTNPVMTNVEQLFLEFSSRMTTVDEAVFKPFKTIDDKIPALCWFVLSIYGIGVLIYSNAGIIINSIASIVDSLFTIKRKKFGHVSRRAICFIDNSHRHNAAKWKSYFEIFSKTTGESEKSAYGLAHIASPGL